MKQCLLVLCGFCIGSEKNERKQRDQTQNALHFPAGNQVGPTTTAILLSNKDTNNLLPNENVIKKKKRGKRRRSDGH